MVFLKKGPIAIEHKTYTALHATSLANHTAGFPDERAETNTLQSRQGSK